MPQLASQPATQLPLTVVMPTLNEAWQIAEAVDSLRWADEVIVADGGSTDGTVTIAREHGARVLEVGGRTIAGQRNAAIAAARNEWVLALDADERATEALRNELAAVLAAPAHAAYRIRRENIYLGRERRRGRWGRDWVVRLFTRTQRFVDERVHERLESVTDPGTLRSPIRHVPYRDLTHHLHKIIVYARWGAQDLHARGRRATLWDLVVRPYWRFVRDYVVYGSFLDGRFGVVTSVLTAYAAFLKYAYLWDLRERPT
jgi:glycosyltransferase involved in cell wall biosynthesis